MIHVQYSSRAVQIQVKPATVRHTDWEVREKDFLQNGEHVLIEKKRKREVCALSLNSASMRHQTARANVGTSQTK